MNTEEFNKAREEITDEQLVNKTREILHKLCETGGRSFVMTVPPRIDDTDMLFGEIINRYKKAIQVQAPVKPANDENEHEIKYDKDAVAILFILAVIAGVMVLGVVSLVDIVADIWKAII